VQRALTGTGSAEPQRPGVRRAAGLLPGASVENLGLAASGKDRACREAAQTAATAALWRRSRPPRGPRRNRDGVQRRPPRPGPGAAYPGEPGTFGALDGRLQPARVGPAMVKTGPGPRKVGRKGRTRSLVTQGCVRGRNRRLAAEDYCHQRRLLAGRFRPADDGHDPDEGSTGASRRDGCDGVGGTATVEAPADRNPPGL